jgi:hypothetical protein
MPGGVKVTLGRFLASEALYRQHNTVSDIGTPFASIPYPFSPLYKEPEFRGTARQSRISLLVEGGIDSAQKLASYTEVDFLGVGVTSNDNESNSWSPRLRVGYLTYDNSDWGFHFLAGQAWSMMTQRTRSESPRVKKIFRSRSMRTMSPVSIHAELAYQSGEGFRADGLAGPLDREPGVTGICRHRRHRQWRLVEWLDCKLGQRRQQLPRERRLRQQLQHGNGA